MRITACGVLELLATYPDRPSLLAEYLFLETEDLLQVLRYAAASLDAEMFPVDRAA